MRNVLCDFDFVSHLPTSNVKESNNITHVIFLVYVLHLVMIII